MSQFHQIRLHGPWLATVLETFQFGTQEFEAQNRCKIPSDWGSWLGVDFRGRVAYRRRFHLPTGLEDDQQVFLIVEQVDFSAAVFLNGNQLGNCDLHGEWLRVEIRNQLLATNELRIEVTLPLEAARDRRQSQAGGLIGSVRLEIAEPAS